jgi:uncharacterized membrane protein YkvA (DUF1232 family)
MRRAPVLRRAQDAPRAAPDFDRGRFWSKIARSALAAGREVVEKALWLYYAAERPEVPRWAKLTIYGALAYFVLPLDAIPDLIPGAGYVDDLGALSTALLTVAGYVNDDVKRRARRRMEQWFGTLPERRD